MELTHYNLTTAPTAKFLTVTIDTGRPHLPVGDYAIDIPIAITAQLTPGAYQGNERLALGVQKYGELVVRRMTSPSQWWSPAPEPPNTSPLATNDTVYQCDASLGTPAVTDCSQLDYSQLGAPSDSLIVGPGTPKLLTFSKLITCQPTYLPT